jgi:hypothetical protein
MRRAIALYLAVSMICMPGMAMAEDEDAKYIAERKNNIDYAMKMIAEASLDLEKAVEKTGGPSVEAGNPQVWRELASQMSRYVQTVDGNLQAIDDNVINLLDKDPAAALPTILLRSPFGNALEKNRKRKTDIEKVIKELRLKISVAKTELARLETKRIEEVGGSITFDYAVQTDRTTNIKTQ